MIAEIFGFVYDIPRKKCSKNVLNRDLFSLQKNSAEFGAKMRTCQSINALAGRVEYAAIGMGVAVALKCLG